MSKLGGRCICKLCDLENTGTCIIEAAKIGYCGAQSTDVQQLKAKIASLVAEFCELYDRGLSNEAVSLLLTKLRQLSAV